MGRIVGLAEEIQIAQLPAEFATQTILQLSAPLRSVKLRMFIACAKSTSAVQKRVKELFKKPAVKRAHGPKIHRVQVIHAHSGTELANPEPVEGQRRDIQVPPDPRLQGVRFRQAHQEHSSSSAKTRSPSRSAGFLLSAADIGYSHKLQGQQIKKRRAVVGRGKYYNRWRQLGEATLHRFYQGGWAARLARRLRLQGHLHIDARVVAIGDASFPPLKVAFVSDLHAGPLTHPAIFDAVANAVNAFAPDILLLGGDYVSLHHRYVDAFAQRVARMQPRFGIFGVFGNHDLWVDDQYVKERLEAAGVQFLINRSVRLPAPYGDVSICGLDEPGTGEPDPAAMFRDAARYRLVVLHSPGGMKQLAGYAFDVAFCGHTHGGQVALPNGKPIILPSGSGDRQFSSGHFQLGTGGQLLVSRGVGMSDLPIRLFAPSEIHLCTIN